jgi:hexosaminidase
VTSSRWTLARVGRLSCTPVLALVLACRSTTPVTSGTPAPIAARAPSVLPTPSSMRLDGGAPFVIVASTPVVVEGGEAAAGVARSLLALLRPSTGFPLGIVSAAAAGTQPAIRLALRPNGAPATDERYELVVTSAGVNLTASQPAGLFRGVQTLRQLLPTDVESHMKMGRVAWTIPAVSIQDAPRFGWRGAMLDVARHFFTVKEVKQYIDVLALYKMNVLHLHLSDDQGFRIVINSRPRLTEIGSVTQVGGGEGGFYTQADYSEIVRYAQERFITIVPEIDMPGHTNAILSAHPSASCSVRPSAPYSGTDVGWSTFCVDSAESYAIIDDIVREISAITPGPYFHMGGDEVHTLRRDQYVKFVEQAQGIVQKYGKRMVGWEEVAKARLLPTSIAQAWASDTARLALQYGAKVLMSPAKRTYIDMKYKQGNALGLTWAAIIDVRDSYEWDPATYFAGVGEADIVGVEAPLWTETVRNIGAAFWLAVPRVPSLAEVGWSQQQNRRWDDFRVRLAGQSRRWEYLGVNYYPSAQVPWEAIAGSESQRMPAPSSPALIP